MICFSSILFLASCQKATEEKREYGWFDFVIPDSDTTHNAVDMSFLNKEVAGSSGFVRVDNGHFVDGRGAAFAGSWQPQQASDGQVIR